MPNCQNCGSFVSNDFARVFTNGIVRSCIYCNTAVGKANRFMSEPSERYENITSNQTQKRNGRNR